jgi:2,6-dihydroxypyridine 3-monooxygenase
MTGWEDDGDGVDVRFANGATQRADLLVCADGVASTARARLLPEVRPEYAGYVCWRGMVPEAALDARTRELFDDAITYYVYANSHALIYPIPGPAVQPGLVPKLS